MTKSLIRATALGLALLTATACATTSPVTPPEAVEFSAQRLSDHIRVLADDSFEGRFPGKVGEELTLNYLQAQYEALGLEPGGPDGQWRQPVDLVRLATSGTPTASWTGPDGQTHAFTPGTDIAIRVGAAGAAKLDNVPLIFAGYGVVAPERGWDDYGDLDLTGKVVVVLSGQPTSFGVDPTFYGSSRHKTDEALKRGAVGVLTLIEADRTFAYYARNAGRARMTIAGAHEPALLGWIGTAALSQMAEASGYDLQTALSGLKRQGFRAQDAGLRITVDATATSEVVRSHNLLARIPGSTRPDEYVVYSAHWDHVGKAETPNAEGDDIFNGAWDNASGTSALIEMARAFKAGPAPERTVVFLHVTAEEQGLLGSEWYGLHPVYPLERTAADINIDMLPFTPATRNIALFGPGKSTLEDTLAELAAAQGGRVVTGEGYPEEGFYYRSDHFNFAAAGVPALMPWTALDLVDGGEALGKPLYESQMQVYYHKLDDEWRADYDFTAAIQNLQLLYRLGLDVADSEAWPQWKPTAEFRATRAASDGERR